MRLQLRVLVPAKRFQLAVLFYDHIEAIGIYELALEENTKDTWTVAREQLVRAEAGNWNISNFTLTDQRIYVAGALDDKLMLRAYNSDNGIEDNTVPAGWLEMVLEHFADQACVPEDLSVWFKKRYDNVSDYMERKKRRIEDQKQPK